MKARSVMNACTRPNSLLADLLNKYPHAAPADVELEHSGHYDMVRLKIQDGAPLCTSASGSFHCSWCPNARTGGTKGATMRYRPFI